MDKSLFYELLLIENSQLKPITDQFYQISKSFMGVFFLIGVLYEFFTQNRYYPLVLRTILAGIILASQGTFLTTSIEKSFYYSEKVLLSKAKTNRLLIGLKRATRLAQREKGPIGPWQKLAIMAKVIINDPISIILWIFIYLAFFLLKLIYSLLFYLLFIFLPVQALFFIPAPTMAGLQGAFKTYMKIITMPPVLAVILILIGNSASFIGRGSTLTQNLEGLVQLFVASILLLGSYYFSSILFSSSGFQASVKHIAGATMGILTTSTLASKFIKRSGTSSSANPANKNRFGFPRWPKKDQITPNDQNQQKEMNLNAKSKKSKKSQSLPFGDFVSSFWPDKPPKKATQKLSSKPFSKEETLQKNAQRFIQLSRKGNIDPKQFSREEKIQAVRLANLDPQRNWIQKSVYLETVKDLNLFKNIKPKQANQKFNYRPYPPNKMKKEGYEKNHRKYQGKIERNRPLRSKPSHPSGRNRHSMEDLRSRISLLKRITKL